MIRVVDTNVLILADDGVASPTPKCAMLAIQYLSQTLKHGCVGLDLGGLILREYQGKVRKHVQPGVGHAFLLHLYTNQYNPTHACQVQITTDAERGFREFPEDPELSSFDPSDRKFVAVALSAPDEHEIANAVDTDWQESAAALARAGVVVRELCAGLG